MLVCAASRQEALHTLKQIAEERAQLIESLQNFDAAEVSPPDQQAAVLVLIAHRLVLLQYFAAVLCIHTPGKQCSHRLDSALPFTCEGLTQRR